MMLAVAGTELGVVGLIVQGGFAALCAYMVWAQEMRSRRAEIRRDKEQSQIREDFAEKDRHVREMMDRSREVFDASRELTMRAIATIDRSTVVSMTVVEAIKKCAKGEDE